MHRTCLSGFRGPVVLRCAALWLLATALVEAADKPIEKPATRRTRQEVEALIQQVGRTPPDWFATTPLNYPKTLDLSWPQLPKGGWNNQQNVSQFMWDVINPNPGRWREGVRLMHHIMSVNKGNKEVIERAMNALGHLYSDCLEDHARGAFWWRVAGDHDLDLACCYWKLGCPEMATEILNGYEADRTRNASIIKLWSDLGQLDKALKLAEAKAANGAPDSAYLAAGDACRQAGRFDEALAFYKKSVEATDGTRDMKRNQARAKASLEAIQLFDKFDPTRVRDGAYTAQSLGYEGPIHVEVHVKQGRIDAVKIVRHSEKQFYSALVDTTRQIVEKQAVKGVDATSGATITSEAIINATAKAIGAAR